MVHSDLTPFEQEQHVVFHDRSLLQMAFVHRSYVNEAGEAPGLADNERLEFLGDSILNFIVSELLHAKFPNHQEGDLTRLRAALVRRETLARFARTWKLDTYLVLGRGEEESGGRKRTATLCDVFEAVVGALYLDQGLEAVRGQVYPLVMQELEAIQRYDVDKDPKSRLQEWAQSTFGAAPRYKVLHEVGPDHDKVFTTHVTIHQQRYGVGRGRSKQAASQAAAAMALHILALPAPEYVPDEEIETQYPILDERPQFGFDVTDVVAPPQE
jgi:ribonuclease-3